MSGEGSIAICGTELVNYIRQDGVWTDTAFDPSRMTAAPVGFGSDGYFDLLTARPEWGAYFALGERVIFVADGTAYAVVEGDAGPITIPPTLVPEPDQPAVEPESAQPAQPEATPGTGTCTGATVMGIIALAAALWWQRVWA